MQPFTLREAGPADLPVVVRFVRALAEYERLLHEAVATEEDFRVALFGTPPRAGAMVAECGAAPVGLCLWYYTFSTFTGRPGLYIEDIFVDPAHRRRGIGLAFFRAMARRAVAEGCARMEWSVLDWNAPAIAFYRKLGAVPKGEWTVQRLSGEALRTLAG